MKDRYMLLPLPVKKNTLYVRIVFVYFPDTAFVSKAKATGYLACKATNKQNGGVAWQQVLLNEFLPHTTSSHFTFSRWHQLTAGLDRSGSSPSSYSSFRCQFRASLRPNTGCSFSPSPFARSHSSFSIYLLIPLFSSNYFSSKTISIILLHDRS
jgi:hypothetical protein